ncbi:hypothetical protein [Deinococcus sp. UYEF24]
MPLHRWFMPYSLLTGLVLASSAQATSCGFASFEQTMKRAGAVVQVEINQQQPGLNGSRPELLARVIALYAGKVTKGDLHILGANKLDTYPSVERFPPGTRWVMALDSHEFQGKALPKNMYAPAGCVQQGLLVSGPIAYGILQGGLRDASVASSVRLSELPGWIRARR